MPPLDEGALLYMPSTLPGISVAEAQTADASAGSDSHDASRRSTRVFGKAGRAETSTDPAPLSMMETIVILKPKSQWRQRRHLVLRLARPSGSQPSLRHITPDHISHRRAGGRDEPRRCASPASPMPGPCPSKPHRHADHRRSHSRRSQNLGADLKQIERIGTQIERLLPHVPGTRSVFAERVSGGYFLDFDSKRDQLARYGLSVDDVQAVVIERIGGDNVTTTVEGRERYPVNVRYMRDFRSDPRALWAACWCRPWTARRRSPQRNSPTIQLSHRPAHAAR